MTSKSTHPVQSVLLPAFLAVILSACGGTSAPTPAAVPAPTPAVTPAPTAPAEFTFSLPASVTVAAGTAVTVPVTSSADAQYAALNAPGDLTVTATAAGLTFTAAPGATPRTLTLTVQGVSGGATRQQDLTVTISAAAPTEKITVTASTVTLNQTQSAVLTASQPVTWALTGGVGTLTVNSATEALYTAPPTLTADSAVTVRASSQRGSAPAAELTLRLIHAPLTVTIPDSTLSIRAGQTIEVPITVNRGAMNLTAALQPGVSVISASPTSLTLRAATNIISSSARVTLRFTSGDEQTFVTAQLNVTGDKVLPPQYAGLDGAERTEERELRDLINAARTQARTCGAEEFPAAPPLQDSAALRLIGRQHLMDSLTRGYTGHLTPEGVTPQERAWAGGYLAGVVENLHVAGADTSPQGALAAWLASPTHCANLMRTGPAFLGVSMVTAGGRTSWSLLLGAAPLGR
ncbi:CAP domain-containing protein [Deinococcus soli (ex Cha et al. 2016)]|uniref:Uncharacterized protein YkwD n=2 Tax=Deinococcus soli (ex Cha et al. 2016) TaxID=1309411 RepID=A0AAE3XCE3_9DEIO|nr:CAP domain-containing protein [Deinococcus soli (ex Cha et al. 2016)]MDR6218339.1 uncharacterized protein YkwD [Deinococcus soli (ex Cha et al. 2016)]MDR6329079.1 uncharacterized protein YkwD [Deinococcus soli (ex Cha et al. 2016)]MDR6751352.1 uncharacterized protein YkwD [Deinococcus soli (ex Cha et al. 2016)]